MTPRAISLPVGVETGQSHTPRPPRFARVIQRIRLGWERAIRKRVPPGLEPESNRRARLIAGFGLLGTFFGAAFAGFYLAIGHVWGAGIVLFCTSAVGGIPFLLRATRATRLCGNLLTLVLLLGFASLCAIEGGVRGHAIAWLAAIPLCALLLVDGAASLLWCFVCLALTGAFVALDWRGITMPVLYAPRWQEAVTAAGYLSLTLFMCVLGLIFEGGRRRAFGKMERAVDNLSFANQRLEKADQEKNEFLGIAAHDLKNPLSIVIGFATMIVEARSGVEPRSREDAQSILEAAQRMLALIKMLLDVNTIEQGHFPINLSPCELGSISRDVVASYAVAAQKKGIVTRTEAIPAKVLADANASYQILDNLYSNAIKYSPPGSEVVVRIRPMAEGFLWEVQDQGAGLSEEDQARLFQKFTKLSTRPTGGESSTGLGLSIVKMLSEAMGGEVGCLSQKGRGSTFFLRLPAADGAEMNAA